MDVEGPGGHLLVKDYYGPSDHQGQPGAAVSSIISRRNLIVFVKDILGQSACPGDFRENLLFKDS